jgi:hypothetical protein
MEASSEGKREYGGKERWVKYWARCGPGSSDGIATGYGLDGPGIESGFHAQGTLENTARAGKAAFPWKLP